MTRVHILLASLVAVLLVVLFWLLLWSPQQDELEATRADIQAERDEQERLSAELERLRSVRDEAPEVEAGLAAASAVVPSDAALPSALRQLQAAADEAGVTLRAVTPSRPTQLDAAEEGVSSIDVAVQLDGSYFQLVDFLRRVEDPSITPRAIAWGDVSLSRGGEYPTLAATASGQMYVQLPGPPEEEPIDADPESDDEDDGDGDDDADVDVDVEAD